MGAKEPDGANQPVTMAEHWNGSAWSVVPTPDVTGYLLSVTCTASADCWAVGTGPRQQQTPPWHHRPLERVAWSQATPASGQAFDQFNSVTCAGPSDCWTVGFAGPNQIQTDFLPGVDPQRGRADGVHRALERSHWSITNAPGAAGPLGTSTCPR